MNHVLRPTGRELTRRILLGGLCLGALSDAGAATAEPQDPEEAVREFRLEFRSESDIPLGNWIDGHLCPDVDWDAKTSSLPELDGRDVRRGAIRVGEDRLVRLAWDEATRQLWADGNWNGDLSDDAPLGEIESFSSYGPDYVLVSLAAPEGAEAGRWSVAVNVDAPQGEHVPPKAWVRSGWTSDIELDGRAYRLVVADDLDGVIEPSEDILLLQSLGAGEPDGEDSEPAEPFRLTEYVQLNERLYGVSFRLEPGGAGGVVVATFERDPTSLVECELTGLHIDRLTFSPLDPAEFWSTIHLELPHGTVRLPPGRYSYRVTIDGGSRLGEIHARGEIEVRPDGENVFRMGAPLANSLRVERVSARGFRLDYRLLGADGEEYAIPSRPNENPALTILSGGREMSSGRFRYG